MIIGFIVVAILSGLPNNIAEIFGRQALCATELAPADGISLVDLFRDHRHVFSGDSFPDWTRASPRTSLNAMIETGIDRDGHHQLLEA